MIFLYLNSSGAKMISGVRHLHWWILIY